MTKIYGITYRHREHLLPITIHGIQTMPLRKMEEMLYRAMPKQSSDPIVKLKIMTETI